jgi:hypothetical protein
MADSPLNIIDPQGRTASLRVGDVPDAIRRRYLTERDGGSAIGFYLDARTATAAFRDHGARLSADRNDPNVVRDLVAIAEHRGWTALSVRGQSDFRREVWMAARLRGLEVQGYQPSERDLQQLARRAERSPAQLSPAQLSPAQLSPAQLSPPKLSPEAAARLRVVDAVVKDRLVEPGDQHRILAAARQRLADWLQRGAHFRAPDLETRRDRRR